MKCPFCHYERNSQDITIPKWKCPSCEKAYSKYSSPIESHEPTQSGNKYREGIGGILIGTVFLYLVISGLISGEFIGIGSAQIVGSKIYFTSRPIEFSLMILFTLFIAIRFISYGIKSLQRSKA